MRTLRLSWPAMAIVLLAMYTCLGAPVDADKKNPEVKLDERLMELRRYYEEMSKLCNEIARIRYGKRDIRETDHSKRLYPDIHGSSVQAVLWKMLFPDSQDTSVKLRPEGTYML